MSRYSRAHEFAQGINRSYKNAEKYGIKGGLLGVAAGAGLGALSSGLTKAPPAYTKQEEKQTPGHRKLKRTLGLTAAGGFTGGYLGADTGARYGGEGRAEPDAALGKTLHKRYLDKLQENSPAVHEEHFNSLNLGGHEKHKAEVSKKIRAALAKAHPDKGGTSAGFIKVKKAAEKISASKWFKKLASTPNLPALAVRKSKKSYNWKPSTIEKIKEYLRVEPEAKSAHKTVAGIGAGVGGATGLIAGAHRHDQINRAVKEKAITPEEAKTLKRKHGIIASTLKGVATGTAASLIPFHALQRHRPTAGVMAGMSAGMLTPLYMAPVTGPHGPFRSKAEEKYSKFDDKKDVALRKKLGK